MPGLLHGKIAAKSQILAAREADRQVAEAGAGPGPCASGLFEAGGGRHSRTLPSIGLLLTNNPPLEPGTGGCGVGRLPAA